MVKKLLFLLFCISISGSVMAQNHLWRVEISLNDRLILPFFIEEEKINNEATLYSVKNGDEKIPLDFKALKNDSIQLSFKEMSSYLSIIYTDSNHFLVIGQMKERAYDTPYLDQKEITKGSSQPQILHLKKY